jgi:hypothetical protein
MKNRLPAWFLVSFVSSPALMAQNGFSGTWKVDYEAAVPTKVNVWYLKDGLYRCTSCSPPISVNADGQDQPVKGQPYDTITVRIVDDQTR